jgi:hypothetical protein
MQAQTRIADLYQTDMDRHLYAFEPRRPLREREALMRLGQSVKGWIGGWAQWRTALAQGFLSIL